MTIPIQDLTIPVWDKHAQTHVLNSPLNVQLYSLCPSQITSDIQGCGVENNSWTKKPWGKFIRHDSNNKLIVLKCHEKQCTQECSSLRFVSWVIWLSALNWGLLYRCCCPDTGSRGWFNFECSFLSLLMVLLGCDCLSAEAEWHPRWHFSTLRFGVIGSFQLTTLTLLSCRYSVQCITSIEQTQVSVTRLCINVLRSLVSHSQVITSVCLHN